MVMKNGQKILTMTLAIMLILTTLAFVGQAAPTKGNIKKTDVSNEPSIPSSEKPHQKYRLKIHAPSEILEGKTFEIFVTIEKNIHSDAKPIPAANAMINVGWNNSTYYTDINGLVTLIAPFVTSNHAYIITASKDGYYSDSVEIIILNMYEPQLVIHAPSSVYEGSYFGVWITADNQSIPGASVVFNGEIKITSSNGSVSFTAPEVSQNMSFIIYASKEGYISVNATIIIMNMYEPQLVIHAPSSVYEGSYFGVEIFADNQTVPGVTVVFNDEVKITSDNGSVSFTAPEVLEDTDFDISASKDGYLEASSIITVLDISNTPVITFIKDNIQLTLTVASVDPENVLWSDIYANGSCNTSGLGTYVTAGDVISDCQGTINITYLPTNTLIGSWTFISPQLEILAPSSVYEGTYFGVLITVENQSIYNARVWFNGIVKRTSHNGSVSFTAPEVNEPTDFEIYAFKTGYISATAIITVLPLRFSSEFGSFGL